MCDYVCMYGVDGESERSNVGSLVRRIQVLAVVDVDVVVVFVVVVVSSFIQILCLPKNPIQCFLLFAACYSPPVRSPKTSRENVENNLDFSRARELKMIETICSFFLGRDGSVSGVVNIYIYINEFSTDFVFSVSCFKCLCT